MLKMSAPCLAQVQQSYPVSAECIPVVAQKLMCDQSINGFNQYKLFLFMYLYSMLSHFNIMI